MHSCSGSKHQCNEGGPLFATAAPSRFEPPTGPGMVVAAAAGFGAPSVATLSHRAMDVVPVDPLLVVVPSGRSSTARGRLDRGRNQRGFLTFASF